MGDSAETLSEEIISRARQVEKDLYVARQLQQSLLPPELLPTPPAVRAALEAAGLDFQISKCHYQSERFRVSGLYVPCDSLGGDLYDFMTFAEGDFGVTVADVSGHGVPAAFITAIFKASFYRMIHNAQTPGDLLYQLNNELSGIVKTGDYITGIYARVCEAQRALVYSGAGHPYPFVYRAATGTVERLSENGPPLIWFRDMDYPIGRLTLAPGDKVLIFSDGLSEMKNTQRDLFGEEALQALFLKHIEQPSSLLLDAMLMDLSDFTEGHPLEDDLSVALIETL